MVQARPSSWNAAAPWLHFLLLLALISLLEVGRRMVGADYVLTYAVIARSVYSWLPALAGIAISIAGPHARCTRTGVGIAFTGVALMIALDATLNVPADLGGSRALFPDASVSPMSQASQLASVSWVRTALEWATGGMPDISQVSADYDLTDPRLRVAEAITEGGLLLVVFASVGFVIAAMSWVRAHVVFKRVEDMRTFHIVLSWLVAPVIVGLTRQFAWEQRFRVLFRDAALWRPLIPSLLSLAVALFLWWYTARYRESEDA
jgi:hypothetical protein